MSRVFLLGESPWAPLAKRLFLHCRPPVSLTHTHTLTPCISRDGTFALQGRRPCVCRCFSFSRRFSTMLRGVRGTCAWRSSCDLLCYYRNVWAWIKTVPDSPSRLENIQTLVTHKPKKGLFRLNKLLICAAR